jgi:endonuclease G
MHPRFFFVLVGALMSVLGCGQVSTPLDGHPDAQFAPQVQGQLLVNPSYLVDFDGPSGVAFWVHYKLAESECYGSANRSDDFRADDRVNGCPDGQSYRASGYDRGHLKPAADSKGSSEEMQSSFLMTNMAPQSPNLNRGIWKELEERVRDWGMTYHEVHVTCGPSDLTLGTLPSGVRVPAAFWKVVMRTDPDTTCLAFRFPNAAEVPGELEDYLVRVDDLEAELGVDLLLGLPKETEDRIEAELPSSVWNVDPVRLQEPKSSPQTTSSSSSSSVQCMGIAKSSGKRCQRMTTDPSGRCYQHKQYP